MRCRWMKKARMQSIKNTLPTVRVKNDLEKNPLVASYGFLPRIGFVSSYAEAAR